MAAKKPAAKKKPVRKFPSGLEVQSLVFDSSRFSPREARSWASAHGFRAPAHERLTTTIRLRQRRKTSFVDGSFRTISMRGSRGGVQAVVALPKGKVQKKASTSRKKR